MRINSYKPDFGLYSLKTKAGAKTFIFSHFKMFVISRIGDKLYSTTVDIMNTGKEFCMTLDFSEEIFLEFIKIIPEELSNLIKEAFQRPFSAPQHVELPYPIEIGVEAKLGKKVFSESGEEFIPFEAIRMFPHFSESPVVNLDEAWEKLSAVLSRERENVVNKKLTNELIDALFGSAYMSLVKGYSKNEVINLLIKKGKLPKETTLFLIRPIIEQFEEDKKSGFVEKGMAQGRKELINYIGNRLILGVPEKQLTADLVKRGFSQDAASNIIDAIKRYFIDE